MSTLISPVLPTPLSTTLDRLAGVRPEEAADAADALTRALAPVAASPWPEVAWRGSTLTGTGFPVELAWASRDTAVRWTCEVAGPELPEPARLDRCAAAADELTGVGPDPSSWLRVQHGHRLRWGAWLGLRHRGSSRAAKVYAELPAGAALPEPWADPGRTVASLVPGLAWRMAGVNGDGSVELYARVPDLSLAALAKVSGLVGDPERLLAPVVALTGGCTPPHPSGVSLVMTPGGTPAAVTWFSFAKALWSSDARTADAVARVSRDLDPADGSLDVYRALTSGPDDGRWRHGMVGVGADAAGGAWLQAGLRPT